MDHKYKRLAERFPRKRAVITGGAAGLGEAIARELADDGWSLLLLDQDRDGLVAIAAELQSAGAKNVSTATVDVSEDEALVAAIRGFCDQMAGVDLLVNSAGIGLAGFAHEAQARTLRQLFDVNVVATAVATAAVLPYMQRADCGHVLNIASAAAYHCLPWIGGYSASKAAVVALTENLCAENHGSGVSASVMISAFFRSSMSKYTLGVEHARERTASLMAMSGMTAREVAVRTLKGVEDGGPYIFVGKQARVIYWIKRWAPRRWLRMARKVAEKAYANADKITADGIVGQGTR